MVAPRRATRRWELSVWLPDQLRRFEEADELEIASEHADGTLPEWLPIWVVRVGGEVFVRTWHRRTTGWFGRVLESHRARVRVPGLEAGVVVEDVGDGPGDLRARIDDAYRTKYARYGGATVERMASDSAAAATLRLVPR
jgi:hypothetical protein